MRGKEHMTKRIALVLVAVGLVILIAVMPVSAAQNVTIAVNGSQNPSLGDEIEFYGVNTASDLTYLFITGPNLPEQGSQIQNPDPVHWPVENQNPSTFQQAGVKSDHTWYWKWDTTSYALANGVYTIYAVARSDDKNHLEGVPYSAVSIILDRQPVTVPASQSTISPSITTQPTATAAIPNPSVPNSSPAGSPGYGALITLVSLGAVAVIATRRY
jgi:PGF-CTERM protein